MWDSTLGCERFTGCYCTGQGKAHLNIGSAMKRAEHTKLFGTPMHGTFNVKLVYGIDDDGLVDQIHAKPFLRHGDDMYWLVRLSYEGREIYAYAVRWKGSKMAGNVLELLSKEPIPDHFKTGGLIVDVYGKWDDEAVRLWQAKLDDKTKFQGHKFWQPQRSDSDFVWQQFRGLEYSGRSVLDVGCGSGYFSFRAAQQGAIVTAMDKNIKIVELARTIQQHIEMTDIDFRPVAETVNAKWALGLFEPYNYIFYLSVQHQWDKTYERLNETIGGMLRVCDTLCLELINPPLAGDMKEKDVDAIVKNYGGKLLAQYEHNVRRMRSIYVIGG